MTARLLRLAGPRPDVPTDRAARVRDRVHREWQAGSRRRAFRRRAAMGAALAAGIAAALLTFRAVNVPPVETLASVESIEGTGTLARGDVLRAGEWVDTGLNARAAFRLADGTSLRLDADARMRLLSRTVIELSRGAVYVDTGRNSAGLEVRTPLGVAYDVGTQFEVRLTMSALKVRVRTGLVEVKSGAQSLSARPGTELTLESGTAVTRTVPAFAPEWRWAARLAPIFEIEGRPLAAFLDHVSREQGWTVRYSDARLAAEASGIILSGSVQGLDPTDAVAVALRTSGLTYQLAEGELVVMRSSSR